MFCRVFPADFYNCNREERDIAWSGNTPYRRRLPLFGSFSKTKKQAQRHAADRMCLLLSDYLGLKEATVLQKQKGGETDWEK